MTNIFSKFFKKKQKEETSQEPEPPKFIPNKKGRECYSCKMLFAEGEPYTKQAGMFFHRHCWKKERKAAGF